MKSRLFRKEDTRDLGFGSKISQQTGQRFLNKDGSFNVLRTGLPFFRSLSLYHYLITIPWSRFQLLLVGVYLAINLVFATGYMLCGTDGFTGIIANTMTERFLESFFFSVETFSTIGYGRVSPVSLVANLLMTVEAVVGLLGVALATGIIFARFSRPQAKILFSHQALIAPFRGGWSFQFRMVNERTNQLINLSVAVTFSRMEDSDDKKVRRYYKLPLERDFVNFFPAHWTVVHPIDEASPLYGLTEIDLNKSDAEFFIMLTGTDDVFSQTVHARTSYKHNEIIWGAKFSDIFHTYEDNIIGIDAGKLHSYEVVEFASTKIVEAS
jgi:inward rectifier potassium channel